MIEFAVISLAVYILLAGIITFGHLLYVAQTLQQAADIAAREFARLPLPPDMTFQQAMEEGRLKDVYDESYLVVDLDAPENANLLDVVAGWPIVNQQLYPVMIVDLSEERRLLRYPGALIASADPESDNPFSVAIPLVTSRTDDGVETIRWVPVIEEIRPQGDDEPLNSPFHIASEQGGVVAIRINYPYQSAMMSGYMANSDGPHEVAEFNPNMGNVIEALDESVIEESPPPGELVSGPAAVGPGQTYAGTYGLGAQAAWGKNVRPFRRVISAQAIQRREIFLTDPIDGDPDDNNEPGDNEPGGNEPGGDDP